MPLNWKKDLDTIPFESFLLFDSCQLGWIDENSHRYAYAMLLRWKPWVSYFIRHKAPEKAQWLDGLEAEFQHIPLPSEEQLAVLNYEVIQSVEDWIVYVLDPSTYHNQPLLQWDDKELLDLADWAGKRVLDIGSGTGRQAFLAAPHCKTVYCVEPVANLRNFLKQRAQKEKVHNLFVVDGLMTALPFEGGLFDIVTSGHVYGDEPEKELNEMLRVLAPDGQIILIPGNNDSDNPIHAYLVSQGFQWGRFYEPNDGWKRKYWR